jgi:hypothetical protein
LREVEGVEEVEGGEGVEEVELACRRQGRFREVEDFN